MAIVATKASLANTGTRVIFILQEVLHTHAHPVDQKAGLDSDGSYIQVIFTHLMSDSS